VRFVAYNLRNYLTMRRYTNGKASYTSKPETEITQLIQILKEAHPDILGVCEIGRNSDLKDLQKKLKQAGINLPYTHRAYGADEVRSLAILSRYPISSWTLPRQMTYTLNNHPFKISRGILDVTIQLPEKKVRFLGVHLKSKRPIEEADQELVRRNESLLLRKHIDDILTSAPETLLMVYGDFNDTKRSKAVRTAKGRSNSKKHMAVLELSDSRGENWTHNWKREDIYSRFDYVMVNRKLAPLIDLKTSRVLDPENGYLASDHRPLLVIIR
jgi:endonuclease/exonuclease/phosphatase family metal-dependent hydrolase